MKIKHLRLILIFILTIVLSVASVISVSAQSQSEAIKSAVMSLVPPAPEVMAEAVILADAGSGKILYGKNIHDKIFPASMTKMMTAIIALEYLDPFELIVTGQEVKAIPNDSSRAYHRVGETLIVENLIRGLIIPSGNETANVVAFAVAKKLMDEEELTYTKAEKFFCGLMNEKAKELGALSTNFVNPHGYHNDRHYSTVYDLYLIAKEAMKNPLIKKIAKEPYFEGNGAGEFADESMDTQVYKWVTHNKIIGPDYFYPYATGIKTGFTDDAGDCLAASAEKDAESLICISAKSADPYRWTDTIALFEYGFNNFNVEIIQEKGEFLGSAAINNPRLGAETSIEFFAEDSFSDYLCKEELDKIDRFISFEPALLAPKDEENPSDVTEILTPIEEGQVIGKVTYNLNNIPIFQGNIIAGSQALQRSFNSDADYYFMQFKEIFFSKSSIPYWIIAFLLLIIMARIVLDIRRRSISRKKGISFK